MKLPLQTLGECKIRNSGDEIMYRNKFSGRGRGLYRRGARGRAKGNFALVVLVIILVLVVALGIFAAVRIFTAPDLDGASKGAGADKVAVSANKEASAGFSDAINGRKILTNEDIIKSTEEGQVLFEAGVFGYLERDLDRDNENELLLSCIEEDGSIDISVYEKEESSVRRNAYFALTEDIFDLSKDSKSEIYIAEKDGKNYICFERYEYDGGAWTLKVYKYDDGFKSVFKEGETEVSEFGLSYTSSDYGEADELKMNGDTECCTLLSTFEIKDGKLELNID